MESIKNKFGSMSKKMVVVIATILLTLTCGVGIVLAAAGGGGGDIGDGDMAGTNFYYYAKWDDVPVYDESAGEWVPRQGWESDSVDYFWRGINKEMDDWVGLRFDSGTTASYQRQVFDEACNQALARVKTRQNQKARIVAVSVFFSNSSAQGGNVALMAQYNENHYTNFFEEPKDYYIDGDHGVLTNTTGNVFDLEHDWWEDCDQVGALPGEKWMHYIWRITGEDTCGSVTGNAPYSVIAIAVNEDMLSGVNLTLNKHIYGEDFPDGSIEKLLYESTFDNPCYDLSGAKFQVFKEDGVTPVEARVRDSNGKLTGEKVPVVFTTNPDGSTDEIYTVQRGEYWLREVQAPNKGFYKDTDGDGIRDELDDSTSFGKKFTIQGGKIIVDGVELQSVGKIDGKDLFAFEWEDEPMHDPEPLQLFKFTGDQPESHASLLTPMPEGNASLNEARFQVSYFKSGMISTVRDLPGFNAATGDADITVGADATAVWKTRSFTDPDSGNKYTGYLDFAYDDPTDGTSWKYNDGLINIFPMGTLVFRETIAPVGYNLNPRIFIINVNDDGTHLTANITKNPHNLDGSIGNDDWTKFPQEWELNGGNHDMTTPWK